MHLRLACLLEALSAHDQIRKVSDHCVAACCFVALLVAATVRFKRFKPSTCVDIESGTLHETPSGCHVSTVL